MKNFQIEKQLVLDYYAALDEYNNSHKLETCLGNEIREKYISKDYVWRGVYPFEALHSIEDVIDKFWKPLHLALTSLQRRMDIFFAGHNQIDDFQSVWVISMGHLVGLFDKAWLSIAPTGKMTFLRYCEFNRIEDGKIVETAMFFDIPHLMVQAGLHPFPKQTAINLVQPGPMTHDGLLFNECPKKEGAATLKTINTMIADLGKWDSKLPLEEELRHTWHEDMIWWGPAGIGSTYTIERYAKQHSRPFRASFSQRSKTRHIARLAEGHFGGFFGWPNFSAYLISDIMGYPATGQIGEFRVIDIYRRKGEKLAENWVFIDLLHFWKQQGIDILNETF